MRDQEKAAAITLRQPEYTSEVDNAIELYRADQRMKGRKLNKREAAVELIIKNATTKK